MEDFVKNIIQAQLDHLRYIEQQMLTHIQKQLEIHKNNEIVMFQIPNQLGDISIDSNQMKSALQRMMTAFSTDADMLCIYKIPSTLKSMFHDLCQYGKIKPKYQYQIIPPDYDFDTNQLNILNHNHYFAFKHKACNADKFQNQTGQLDSTYVETMWDKMLITPNTQSSEQ